MFRKMFVLLVVFALALALVPPAPAAAQSALPGNCALIPVPLPPLAAQQYYLYCTPVGVPWNGDVVVYAHGYVPPLPDVNAAWSQLVTPDGTSIPGIINSLGFAFAATSYSKNGLAVKEGLADTLGLAQVLKSGFMLPDGSVAIPPSNHLFIVGASEGGLIATQAMEILNTPFTSGVAGCGPIGDFRKQINYFGDFRILFDYFFKNVLPPGPVSIPPALFGDWMTAVVTGNPGDSVYQQSVLAALQANPGQLAQLISTGKAAIDPNDPSTAAVTAMKVLNYNVVATMESMAEIGMQSYTNKNTFYFGSSNDFKLNRGVERIPLGGTEAALAAALAPYQTTGLLQAPLVTIHTVYDPEDPIWHQALYRAKVWKQNKAALYTGIPILRYGHCNFTGTELMFAFALAYSKGTHQLLPLSGISQALPGTHSAAEFQNLMKQYGEAAR